VYCLRYHRDPLVHGEEEPGASSQHEQCIGHFVTLFSAPRRNWSARSWPHRGSVTGRSSIKLRSGFHSLVTFWPWSPRRCSGRGDFAPELVTSIRLYAEKGGRMSWSWRDLVVLTFLVMLLGTAMVANVSLVSMSMGRVG